MIVAAVLWLAVCLCGSGLIGGAEISCDGKYKRECESFNKDFPTISMLMHDRKARAVMRGCLFPGVLLNGASDVGLAATLAAGRRPNSMAPSRCTSSVTARAAGSFDGGCPRLRRGREADDAPPTLLGSRARRRRLAGHPRLRGAGFACNAWAAVFGIASLVAILVGLGTNPRGTTHITACVSWAFLRIGWGLLILRALWDASPGPFTLLRFLFGGAVALVAPSVHIDRRAFSGPNFARRRDERIK